MTTTAPAQKTPPTRPAPRQAPQPVTPRPLWERHQLFQEPQFPDGLDLEGDADSNDDEDAA